MEAEVGPHGIGAATLPRRQLVKRTPRTVVAARPLARELTLTRERGYALDCEENEAGVNCIGFPIFIRSGGRPSGAISVSAAGPRKSVDILVASADEVRAIIETHLGRVTSERTALGALGVPLSA